jgi:hypothetical protein
MRKRAGKAAIGGVNRDDLKGNTDSCCRTP